MHYVYKLIDAKFPALTELFTVEELHHLYEASRSKRFTPKLHSLAIFMSDFCAVSMPAIMSELQQLKEDLMYVQQQLITVECMKDSIHDKFHDVMPVSFQMAVLLAW